MDNGLRPCLHCGEQGVFQQGRKNEAFLVCRGCGLSFVAIEHGDWEQRLRDKWNRSDELDKAVELLKACRNLLEALDTYDAVYGQPEIWKTESGFRRDLLEAQIAVVQARRAWETLQK